MALGAILHIKLPWGLEESQPDQDLNRIKTFTVIGRDRESIFVQCQISWKENSRKAAVGINHVEGLRSTIV